MTNIKPTSHIEQIAASKLIVDPEVQRYVEPARVTREAARFNPMGLGVLIVSRRPDGTNHVIDGGHRQGIVTEAGFPDYELDCKVWTGLTREQEAAMFRVHNNTKVVPPIDKHKVAVVEGNPVAVDIEEVLRAHGWRIQHAKDKGVVMAVNALYTFYGWAPNQDTAKATLHQLFTVLTNAWGHDPDGANRSLILGIGNVLLRHPDKVDEDKFTRALASGGPLTLLGAARQLTSFRRGTLHDAVSAIVVKEHNKGRTSAKNRIPGWV